GLVAADSEMDFRTTPSRLRFGVKVDGLVLSKLPAAWEMPVMRDSPAPIEGKVSGSADLVVRVGERVVTTGAGKGQIDATLLGFQTTRVQLVLHTENGRIRILPRLPFFSSFLGAAARPAESATGLPIAYLTGVTASRAHIAPNRIG